MTQEIELREKSSAQRLEGKVPCFLPEDLAKQQDTFDNLYQHSEPWNYSERAIEWVRFDYVEEMVKARVRPGATLLDVGCAFGQLTERFRGLGAQVWALDLSKRAALMAHERIGSWAKVICASSTDMSCFPDESFDFVVLSDGLQGWEINDDLKLKVLQETQRILKPNGFALLTDYLGPKHFKKYIELIRSGPLDVLSIDYLGDRIGFQITTNLEPFRWVPGVRQIIASHSLAKAFCQYSKGSPRLSKHLGILCQKNERSDHRVL